MADAYTTLRDFVVIPEEVTRYVQEATVKQNALVRAGLVSDLSNMFDWGQVRGGKVVNVPFYKQLGAGSQVLPDDNTSKLNVGKITTGNEIAVIQARGDAWATNELAGFFAGEDPMGAIADLVGQYWSDDLNNNVFSILKGIFANSAFATAKLNDISAEIGAASNITAEGAFNTVQNGMGDAKGRVTGIYMHSAVESYLRKQDLIQYVQDSTVGMDMPFAFGKRVVLDDTLTTAAGEYLTVFSGPGAMVYGTKEGPNSTELFRDELAGTDGLISRSYRVVHPRGLSFTGTPAGSGPSDAELEVGTNWTMVGESKNIALCAMKHKIDQV